MLKKFFDILVFIFTSKGEIANEMVNEGILDLGGQGRDQYGK